MGKTTATKRHAKTPAAPAKPAPAKTRYPPFLLRNLPNGKPSSIAAAAYTEIKFMWYAAQDWAAQALRAAGMDAGKLPAPAWLRPSNWNPEMVAGLLCNRATSYRLRPEWFEALVYLEDGYPFAMDAGEVLRRCYVRELGQWGDDYDAEYNALWPLVDDWPQGAGIDEERRAVIEIALAKHARELARAMACADAIAQGNEPRAVSREDELEAQERAAVIVAAAIERARKCAAPKGEPPRALTRAQMLEWLALAVRDMAPAQPPAAPTANGTRPLAPALADSQCKRITFATLVTYLFARYSEKMVKDNGNEIRAKDIRDTFYGKSKNKNDSGYTALQAVKTKGGVYPIKKLIPYVLQMLSSMGVELPQDIRKSIEEDITQSTRPGGVYRM